MDRVGPEEGKLPVHRTGKSWGGLNSCSILEPFVRLYRLTGKPAYLAFSEHIIEMGGSTLANIFELAYKNELYPYQYGVSKAYEMISCFEGLLEYYLLTGIEKYKTAIVNFGKALINSDVSVIGSLGATHELLDHTKNRQTAYTDTVRQETCVTVTWMKFCARLLRLTGESIFADQLELSYFNAYRGSLNTEHRTYEKYLANKCFERLGLDRYVDTFLPFDSYAPLTPGRRGRAIGGHQMLHDLSYYGCCACIGVAGIGSYMESFALSDKEGIVINLYEEGEMTCQCGDRTVHITMKTDYPKTGSIHLTVKKEDDAPLLCKIRIPEWSKEAYLINLPNTLSNGYAALTLTERSTSFTLVLDMRMRMIKPEVWDRDLVYTDRSLTTKEAYLAGPMQVEHRPEDDNFVCMMRGPITLAADSRLGKDAASSFTLALDGGEPVWRLSNEPSCLPDKKEIVHCIFEDAEGGEFSLVDYGAAGRDWNSTITAWLPTKQ